MTDQNECKHIFDSISDLIMILDLDYKIISVNSAVKKTIGKSDKELQGKHCYTIFHGTDHPPKYCPHEKLLKSTTPEVMDMEMEALDGHYLVTVAPIFDDHGKLVRTVHIAKDITERKKTETALRDNKDLLSQAIRVGGIGIFEHDHIKDTYFWSEELKKIYDADTTPTLPEFIELIHPEDRDLVAAAVKRAHDPTGDGAFDIEFRCTHRDSTTRWVSTRSVTFFEGDGENRHPIRTIGAVRDITHEKTSRDDLAKSEGKIRTLFNASSDALVIANASGRILEANKAAEEMFGYANGEMARLPLTELMPERYRTDHTNGIKRTVSTRKTAYLNRVLEFHGITKEGREFPLELNVATWFVDKDQYFSGIIRDISERRKAEAALRESEEKLNVIFNSTNDGILVVDVESRKFVSGNSAICKMLGFTQEELLRLGVDDIHPAEKLQEVHLQFERQRRKEIDVYHNAPVMRKDKTVFFADINATPAEFGGKHYMIGLFRDVTERIQLENKVRQAEKMEAIGTLAGGIAHDFNNILSPIIGYTELVMESLPNGSEEVSLLNEVKKASIRAKELVTQILTFSRKNNQEKKPLKIQPIIKEALKLLRSSIPSTIEIRQDIDDNCGPIICDPTQIHQIIMNLCTNAYHAMMQDGGILEVSIRRITVTQGELQSFGDLPAGTYIRIIVSDSGQGMDKNTMNRIFEPYFTTKKQGEGTGLGLSLVHRIVENHNGRIKVYSNPGEGSTFTIYLPEIMIPEKDMVRAEQETLPSGTEHILLVDDEESIVAMLTRILKNLGYQVTGLTDSIQALERFKENKDQFDLVITDQTMPHIPGSVLAKRMLEINPKIPIILCSGFSSLISNEKAGNLGVKQVLMKPVMRSELAKVIRSVLDDR